MNQSVNELDSGDFSILFLYFVAVLVTGFWVSTKCSHLILSKLITLEKVHFWRINLNLLHVIVGGLLD